MRMSPLFGLVLTISATAFAGPSHHRKQDVRIDVKLTARTKPLPPPESHTLDATRPTVSADDILATEDQTEPLRTEQQAILIQLVHDTPDTDPDKPDCLFRLAEQYALQLRHWRLRATEAVMQRE